MSIDIINKIIKSYNEKKRYMNPSIVGEDIVSFTIRQQTSGEFLKLKNDTTSKLIDLYENINIKLKELTDNKNRLEFKLSKVDDYFERPILQEKYEKMEIRITDLIEQRDLINTFLKNEFGIDYVSKEKKKETEDELIDMRKELNDNSKALEELVANIPSLNVKSDSIADNNNENLEPIKSRSVKLSEGKYVSRIDFKRAVIEYYGKTKNQKMIVVGTRESELTPTNIKDLQDLFSECHSIFIDLDRNAYTRDKYNVEMIGKVSESIKPGSYISLSDALDEVSGGEGRSLVKKHE